MKNIATLVLALVILRAAAVASADEDDAGDVGVSLGVRLGYAVAMGSVQKDTSMSQAGVTGAIPFQIEAAYRVVPNIGVGVYFNYAVVSLDRNKAAAFGGVPADFVSETSVSGHWIKFGVQGQYKLNPGEATPWFGLGIGLEQASASLTWSDFSGSETYHATEFVKLSAGYDFLGAANLGIGPFVELSLGQYSSVDSTSGGGPSSNTNIDNKAMHEWLYFGVRGNYDL